MLILMKCIWTFHLLTLLMYWKGQYIKYKRAKIQTPLAIKIPIAPCKTSRNKFEVCTMLHSEYLCLITHWTYSKSNCWLKHGFDSNFNLIVELWLIGSLWAEITFLKISDMLVSKASPCLELSSPYLKRLKINQWSNFKVCSPMRCKNV